MGGVVVGRPVAAASGNAAAAVATATLPAAPNRKTYLCGFHATGSGSTAGAAVSLTVTGLENGLTLTYTFTAPTGVLVGANPLTVAFDPPLPASAVNTPIVVSMPSLGAGSTNAAVVAHGFTIES